MVAPLSQVAEVRRAEERKKGAEVLAKQIEERSKERIKQEELINQERSQMLKVSPRCPVHYLGIRHRTFLYPQWYMLLS